MSETTAAGLPHEQLFTGSGESVFAILDGASVPDCPHLLWEPPGRVVRFRRFEDALRDERAPLVEEGGADARRSEDG